MANKVVIVLALLVVLLSVHNVSRLNEPCIDMALPTEVLENLPRPEATERKKVDDIDKKDDPNNTSVSAFASSISMEPLSKTRRKFLSYHSSPWEQLWLDHVDEWEKQQTICAEITGNQRPLVHDLMNLTCTARYAPPYDDWCIIDDFYNPLWWNTAERTKFHFSWVCPLPKDAKLLTDNHQPVVPTELDEHVVSKFVFLDESTGEKYVEYIEPLISHLRFPLANCVPSHPRGGRYPLYAIRFRGWLIPPPPDPERRKDAVYFDAGASSWDSGKGGPSLKYFVGTWKRHGIEFHDIHAFEMRTPPEQFYETVPEEFKTIIHYQNKTISSSTDVDTDQNPFIPGLIKRLTNRDEYVLLKVDIDSPKVENGNIEFILQDSDNFIDEVVWEHHVKGNYLLRRNWLHLVDKKTIRESYEYFLKMRQKGIRAHSWV